MKQLSYSVVIPAYNESKRLRPTLDSVLAYVTSEKLDAELIVVNDGSTDGTADLVKQYASQYPNVRLLENPSNRGKGYSVRNGMMHANGDVLLLSDADLSSPIEEASKLFEAIGAGNDIAIGSRWLDSSLQTERQTWLRQIYGRVFNVFLRLLLGLKQKDTQCGFKAFTRSAALSIFPLQKIERWGFDPELLYIADRFKFKVAEVPVKWADDAGSKINPLRDGLKMVEEAFRIRWNGLMGNYNPPLSESAAATAVAER